MTNGNARYDVVIVGAGVTGLSAARHLAAGPLKVAVVSDPARHPLSGHGAGMAAAGLMDNFTRVVVGHGEEFAKDLWRWGATSFEALETFCVKHKVPWRRGMRQRLVVSPEEKTEVLEAVTRLQDAGFPVRYLDQPRGVGVRVLGIQDEGQTGAWVDCTTLLKSLREQSPGVAWHSSPVSKIERSSQSLTLHTAQGTLHAEMVVLANHLEARTLLPEIKDVMVPYADQWVELACEKPLPAEWQKPGTVFSAFHGYEWGVIKNERTLVMGGGRFLRPMAGIGAEKPSLEEKVTQYLLRQCESIWPNRGSCQVRDSHAFLECLPCDELPIVGPFYGDSRILLAGGYGGSGLTMGFWAGKCLADFVQNGRSTTLPARLLPARLRSLS